MDSDSSLSSPPTTDDESAPPAPVVKKTLTLKGGKLGGSTGPPPKPRKRQIPLARLSPSPSPEREQSPPHDYVLADNPDIAVLVMFRSRFAEVFNKNVPNLGPQDIELGVVGEEPSEQVEQYLCALLGLVLNRKKYVERGHHGRALDECIQSQKSQWPLSWGGVNPLSGSRTFSTLTALERINVLKTITVWCLSSSEVIINIIKESYKQTRHEDDVNQPLSVQPWGVDGRKRRYWLIEGQNDTTFRLYRESAHKSIDNTWWSLAGTIDELKVIGDTLRAEGSQAARRLAEKFTAAIPRLELTEEKRKKKEYRISRRAAFQRPEPGFSLYEGRTRGKRMKYTFSDEEDYVTDNSGARRSARHSSRDTPVDPAAPTITASGRHVRSRFGKSYGDPMRDTDGSSARGDLEDSDVIDADQAPRADGRPRRSGRAHRPADDGYGSFDELDDEVDKPPSGEEWSGDDNDIEGRYDDEDEEDDAMSDDGDKDSLLNEPKSLIVNLRYKTGALNLDNTDHNQAPIHGPDVDIAEDYETASLPNYTAPTQTEAGPGHYEALANDSGTHSGMTMHGGQRSPTMAPPAAAYEAHKQEPYSTHKQAPQVTQLPGYLAPPING